MMKRNEIRRARPDDAGEIAAVHIKSWQVAYKGILPAEFLESLNISNRTAYWRRVISEKESVLVAADGRVIGFCTPIVARGEQGWGEISAIYLDPDRWGEGWGRALLSAGEDDLASRSFDRALLWVLKDNHRARSFYEKSGWKLGKRFQLLEIGGAPVTEVRYEKKLAAGV